EDGEVHVLEHAGPAEVRLAAELRARARLSRSARSIEGPRGRGDWRRAEPAGGSGETIRTAAQGTPDRARHAVERRLGKRSGADQDDRVRGQRSGERDPLERFAIVCSVSPANRGYEGNGINKRSRGAETAVDYTRPRPFRRGGLQIAGFPEADTRESAGGPA